MRPLSFLGPLICMAGLIILVIFDVVPFFKSGNWVWFSCVDLGKILIPNNNWLINPDGWLGLYAVLDTLPGFSIVVLLGIIVIKMTDER